MLRVSLAAALLTLLLAACSPSPSVTINGEPLPDEMLQITQALYSVTIQPGAYWYDAATGAWGLDGQPTAGFMMAGLDLGGPLRADASHGQTGVYLNGRNLPAQDLAAFESISGPITPGRYWLDASGNAGLEGGPALLNFMALAQQRARPHAAQPQPYAQQPSAQQNAPSPGSDLHRNWYTGTGSNSSGGSGYVMGSDWSVSW